jgi:hypothetical protein
MWFRLLFAFSQLYLTHSSTCVCTTVDCPVEGSNKIIMGNGSAIIDYTYKTFSDYPLVSSATGTITPDSLDHGSGTTSCTQSYSRMLEDDGADNCDAGHILANRLGGYGNTPINIFPQSASVNRGIYAQFEGDIYDCMQNGTNMGYLSWDFFYENEDHTMPNSVKYTAKFDGGSCGTISSTFPN